MQANDQLINNKKSLLAERIKNLVLTNGGYEKFSKNTGISTSTLFRITTAKTSPKLSDIVKISEYTESDLNYLVYGYKNKSDISKALQDCKKEIFEVMENVIDQYAQAQNEILVLKEVNRKLKDELKVFCDSCVYKRNF